MRWHWAWLGALALILVRPVVAVEAFFAAPVPAGSVAVDLHATEVVTVNTPVVASFGVPFSRGSIRNV